MVLTVLYVPYSLDRGPASASPDPPDAALPRQSECEREREGGREGEREGGWERGNERERARESV